MSQTAIQWATHVWNPFTGCDRVSPGCAHCYALDVARGNQRKELGRAAKAERDGKPQAVLRYQRDGDPRTSGPGFGFTVHRDKLENPERFPAGARVFVNSMSDVFHEDAPVAAIAQLWAVFMSRPDVDWLLLTKRPGRMRDVLTGVHRYKRDGYGDPCEFPDMVIHTMLDWSAMTAAGERARSVVEPLDFRHFGPAGPGTWPLPNVWLGVTIENRRFVDRADVLRDTPAAVRFISAEPLLGPLVPTGHGCYCFPGVERADRPRWHDGYTGPALSLGGIDWLIVGGESGSGARRMNPQWTRDLITAGQHAGTAVFVKQLGKVLARELDVRDRSHGGDIDEWPRDLRVRVLPKVREATSA